jgi:hypothetical protein
VWHNQIKPIYQKKKPISNHRFSTQFSQYLNPIKGGHLGTLIFFFFLVFFFQFDGTVNGLFFNHQWWLIMFYKMTQIAWDRDNGNINEWHKLKGDGSFLFLWVKEMKALVKIGPVHNHKKHINWNWNSSLTSALLRSKQTINDLQISNRDIIPEACWSHCP